MNTLPPCLILLWGVPAAGKSTLAYDLVRVFADKFGRELCHLGTDRLNQAILGDQFHQDVRSCLYEGILNLADGLLSKGKSVLVEGTFLKPDWRHRLSDLAAHHNARYIKVQIECRLSLVLQRNAARTQTQRVPEDFMRKAHQSARDQAKDSDFVFDTELVKPQGLARFLVGEMTRESA